MKISFKSPNLTGKSWITRLEKGGYTVRSYAKELLEKVIPTKNTYNIVILKMDKDYYTMQEVRDEAKRLGYVTPPVELGPLLRENITSKNLEELGLWWLIVAHEPITDSDGGPSLLGLDRGGGGRGLNAYGGWSTDGWDRGRGFVCLAPQVSTKSSKPSELALESQNLVLNSDLEKAIETCKKAGLTVTKTY